VKYWILANEFFDHKVLVLAEYFFAQINFRDEPQVQFIVLTARVSSLLFEQYYLFL
jgi:hypothetical protein